MFGLTMATLGAYLAAVVIFGIIFYVLKVIACWKIFTKAGEPGWKSLIPIYNTYIEYKIAWRTEGFWALLAAAVISAMTQESEGFWMYVGIAAGIIASAIQIMRNYKLSKAFGHGIGYTLGLIFLPNIFELILGLSNDPYLGPQ